MSQLSEFRKGSFTAGVVSGMIVLGAIISVVFFNHDVKIEPNHDTTLKVEGGQVMSVHAVAPLLDNGTNRVYTEYVLAEIWTEVETENPLYPVGPKMILIKLPHLVRMTRGEYEHLKQSYEDWEL